MLIAAMKLYLATGNPHKIGELTAMLAAARIEAQVFPPSAVGGMPPVVEDTGTFAGNAAKKALALAMKLPRGTWAIADDSGLCVGALDGAPGVESAYFAGTPTNDAANNAKLLELLRDVPAAKRTATFQCTIVAAMPTGQTESFEGRCRGRILGEPRGTAGFGYDPLFVPEGYEQSYAELSAPIKNVISHRGRALAQFVAWLQGRSTW